MCECILCSLSQKSFYFFLRKLRKKNIGARKTTWSLSVQNISLKENMILGRYIELRCISYQFVKKKKKNTKLIIYIRNKDSSIY